jgi:hypothetical protein
VLSNRDSFSSETRQFTQFSSYSLNFFISKLQFTQTALIFKFCLVLQGGGAYEM